MFFGSPRPTRKLQSSFLTFAPILLSACARTSPPTNSEASPEILTGIPERAGIAPVKDTWGDHASRLVYLDQGWGVPETLWYYFADQGSALMPYTLLVKLEQPESESRLIDPENLARYRFLPQRATPNNPEALPVGLARHGDQVGLTCAACHTGQLTYRGTAVRIDGAPALVNIAGFFDQIRASLRATLADEAKLERLLAASQGAHSGPPSAAQRAQSVQLITDTLAWFDAYSLANRSTTVEGFGRLDAVGRIMNEVIGATSGRKNSVEPNAPNSFPLLWDAPRHDYVQWAGFSPNAELGSLGRNVGEVVGVYAQVTVKRYDTEAEAKKGYPSSVEAHNIVSMEESLYGLKSPKWPEEILPPIDRSKASRGAELYLAHCVRCHALIDRDDPKRRVVAMVTAIDVVGTDPQSSDNLIKLRVPTGVLEGAISTDGKRTYGATESGLTLLTDIVTRILSTQPTAAVRTLAYAKRVGLDAASKQGDHHAPTEADPTADLRSYKARPLNGAWASAPYLHNGSVPSLYELLLPVAQRPERFVVGRWEYDPVKVGYVSEGEEPWVLDTTLIGNRNVGHEYGTALPDEQRWDLVEYLKTL